jgi:hypothetical protein
VNTLNDGGLSEWATGSFTTVPPMVQVTVPNGGEACQRGKPFIIQWKANVTEKVALDLYTGGMLIRSLATNAPDAGVYTWQVSATNAPASDYSIKIRSTSNAALFDTSDATFSIVDPPTITPNSVTPILGGKMQLGFTAPGATQATVWGTTNLSPASWQSLGAIPLTTSDGQFIDTNASGFPMRFYRVTVP